MKTELGTSADTAHAARPALTARTTMVAVALAAAALAASLAAPPSRAQAPACDRDCLVGFANRYMAALVAHTPDSLPWADRVRFTENEVPLMIGDGAWGTVTKITGSPLTAADPETGNALWYGIVEEHGQPAYFGVRLGVVDGRIAEVESVVGRAGTPMPFADPAGYSPDPSFAQALAPGQREPRARLLALADGYYNTMQLDDGTLFAPFDPTCRRLTNGVVSRDDGATDAGGEANGAAGRQAESGGAADDGPQRAACGDLLANGYFKPVDRVRARRFPIVDEARGVVVAFAFLDHAARAADYRTRDGKRHTITVQYPNSYAVLELIELRGGKVYRVEGVGAFVPYLMPTIWRP